MKIHHGRGRETLGERGAKGYIYFTIKGLEKFRVGIEMSTKMTGKNERKGKKHSLTRGRRERKYCGVGKEVLIEGRGLKKGPTIFVGKGSAYISSTREKSHRRQGRGGNRLFNGIGSRVGKIWYLKKRRRHCSGGGGLGGMDRIGEAIFDRSESKEVVLGVAKKMVDQGTSSNKKRGGVTYSRKE